MAMFDTIEFAPTTFNIIVATAGGFLLTFGLVSHGVKQRLLLSEALVAVSAGVLLSRIAPLVQPRDIACGGSQDVKTITLEFSRLVLGIQLLLAGVELPSRYVQQAKKSLFYLLGPGLILSWICAGLVIWLMMPQLGYVRALAIAACIAPTDPILSNAIIKGRFAERNTPKPVRELISAEAGLNDGLGYPFLFFSLFWIQYIEYGSSPLKMLSSWFLETWLYVILLSIVYGAVLGYLGRKLQMWSVRRKLIEDESSTVFAVALSLFILGTSGILKTDDVLACFVAGCVFGWDHRFQPHATNELFCSSIDMLLNASIFVWYGAVAPWSSFLNNSIISLPKLLLLGALVLLLRRLPIVLILKPQVVELQKYSQAAFVGFFGPIGVSAIYYLMLAREFLQKLAESGSDTMKTDAKYLEESMWLIIWSLVMYSVVVHGLALPISKGFRAAFPKVYRKYLRPEPTQQAVPSDGEYLWKATTHDEQQANPGRGTVYGTMNTDSTSTLV